MTANQYQWYADFCRRRHGVDVSPLAVELALTATERGMSDSTYDWVARNAVNFEEIMKQYGKRKDVK